jgi:hypothetical protein
VSAPRRDAIAGDALDARDRLVDRRPIAADALAAEAPVRG